MLEWLDIIEEVAVFTGVPPEWIGEILFELHCLTTSQQTITAVIHQSDIALDLSSLVHKASLHLTVRNVRPMCGFQDFAEM